MPRGAGGSPRGSPRGVAEGVADASSAATGGGGALTRGEKEEAETRKLEAELRAELDKADELREELDELRRERLELEAEAADLDARESAYWDDFNDFKLALERHVDERDSLVVSVEQTGRQLERLRRTNVFNDAFHIWFDGPFGTVNGFRLGRLSNVAVEWDEINAAWGMACLLLSTMANAVKLEFSRYTLKPMGSFSKVVDAKETRTNCTGRSTSYRRTSTTGRWRVFSSASTSSARSRTSRTCRTG